MNLRTTSFLDLWLVVQLTTLLPRLSVKSLKTMTLKIRQSLINNTTQCMKTRITIIQDMKCHIISMIPESPHMVNTDITQSLMLQSGIKTTLIRKRSRQTYNSWDRFMHHLRIISLMALNMRFWATMVEVSRKGFHPFRLNISWME